MWYRIYATFGPGSQGTDEFYRWSNTPLTEGDKNELKDEMIRRWDWTDQVTVRIEMVPSLPRSVRDEMLKECENAILRAHHMMTVLSDPTKTPVRE